MTGGGATAERNGQAGGSPAGNACTPGQSLTPRTDAFIDWVVPFWCPSKTDENALKAFRATLERLACLAIEEATEHMMRELNR